MIEKFQIKQVHISEVRMNDTVLHNGDRRTVGKNDINHGGFMGSSLFGDSYRLGTKLVSLVMFPHFSKGKQIGWRR